MFMPAEARWSPAPPGLPAGAEITVLEGDPTQPGVFTIQLRVPDGYKVMPHWHPTDERQTLVKGTMMMGMGEKWNESDMKEMTPGAFVLLPKHNPHYVMAKGEAILQVQATGPYDMTYINPSDDPRKK
jgi:quercetin dioxygenase-like cupin family protein